jgi:anti-anti-sigma regulatory factor
MTKLKAGPHETVIRVEGALNADSLREFAGLLVTNPPPSTVTIDLSGVTSVDRAWRGHLIGLREDGCRLVGCSLYVHRLLEETELWDTRPLQ